MSINREPFVGSEALANGLLSRHQLRTQCRALYPDVYVSRHVAASLSQRVAAAWLWSGRKGVVAGLAAAAVHGAKWVDDDLRIELIHANPRAPRGLVTRRFLLHDDEQETRSGMQVTTQARTAFDIGRTGDLVTRVARLDALVRATDLNVEDVMVLALRHPGSPGLRRLETALDLVDGGAQSPKETSLRLLLIQAGLPRPDTQIAVLGDDGHPLAYLDMGWERWMVAVEYDGDQHRTDRRQYVKDIRRIEMLERMGWIVIRVVAEDHPANVVARVRAAIARSQSGVR
jgi:Protein of unknown function (DUF559)